MKIPSSARYNYCCKKAIEFLINENIILFPFDADEIMRKYKWSNLKYSQLALKHNVSINDIIESYDSEDGYTIFNGRNYSITYNDTIATKQRIYFTKLHEIGHIYLGHFKDFSETILSRSNISESQYKILENEANCFARNVLSPIVLVDYLNLSKSNIVNAFNVTDAAATTRLDFKRRDLYWITSHDYKLLLEHFKPFIYKATHAYHCSNCQTVFVAENANYCPICSNRAKKIKLHIRSDFDMIYPGYKVTEKGQLMQCIHCQNEEIEDGAYYCKICGASVVNECSHPDCRRASDSNARYCISCGSETTFYKQGLLPAQEEAAAAINNDFLGPL